jgi:hypothetical protein
MLLDSLSIVLSATGIHFIQSQISVLTMPATKQLDALSIVLAFSAGLTHLLLIAQEFLVKAQHMHHR